MPDPLPSQFNVRFNANDLCCLEAESKRDRFCIVLTRSEYFNNQEYYAFKIWVKGLSGYINIPNDFTEMTEYHFSLLYEV